MIIVIRFKYVLFYLVSLLLLTILLCGRVVLVDKMADGAIRVVLVSFLPLRTAIAPTAFTVTSAEPRQAFRLIFARSRFFKVAVLVRESRFPKGSPVTVKLTDLPTWVPGITRSFRRTVLPRVKPAVLHAPPVRSGTRGPLRVVFNTPLRQHGLRQLIRMNFAARLVPGRYRWQRRLYTDYATWRIIPTQPLRHRFSYQIRLRPGITGIGGQKLLQGQQFSFTTVAPLQVIAQTPLNGSRGFPTFLPLRLTADRQLCRGRVWLPGYSGETAIEGETLTYYPSPVLLPDTLYRARVSLSDRFGESIDREWHFHTASLGAALWVEVNLRVPQTITVYQGKKVLKVLPASGPDSQTRTLRGNFRVVQRGYAFYSPQLREGAYYWLRLTNGWLIHSLVFGRDGQINADQITRLGQPTGNGSIRVKPEAMKWLYHYLSPKTPVLIHGPPRPGVTDGLPENRYAQATFFHYRAEFERFWAQMGSTER